MNCRRSIIVVLAALAALALLLPVFWPQLDLIISGLFYVPGEGFVYADHPALQFLHGAAYYGARGLGAFLAFIAVMGFFTRMPFLGIDAKGWAFLFLGLLLGPALVANVILKDHWGRARPREVTEFGGKAAFSPALLPQPEARRNGSFVCGDGAFGFYLPSFAYVAPKRRARRFLLGGIGAGFLLGAVRIAMGAHFFSDVAFAALFMFATAAFLHAVMFGRRATAAIWREWLCPG